MKNTIMILTVLGLVFPAIAQEKEGYFLPMDQKGNLIWQGAVEDSGGTWYDIRIVPGYKPPATYGWKHIKEGGRNLHEYVEAEKYENLRETSSDVLEWSYDDCLTDFTFKGAGKAWKKYTHRAAKRTEKRVFGWWLSYPWAVMQGCVDNVVRIPAGLAGTAVGTGWAVVVVPAYHAVDSGTKAVWNTGVNGCVLPVSGWAWNTVASPPLSLLGQMPSHERVDGFWVREVEQGFEPGKEPDRQAKAEIAEWGILLKNELQPYESQRKSIDREQLVQLKKLEKEKRLVRAEMARRKGVVEQAEAERIEALYADQQHGPLGERVHGAYWNKNNLRYYEDDIRSQLKKQGLNDQEQQVVLRILRQHPPSDANYQLPKKADAYEKTDPLRESAKVIQEIE